jgi:GT2 family glycosyltransferase
MLAQQVVIDKFGYPLLSRPSFLKQVEEDKGQYDDERFSGLQDLFFSSEAMFIKRLHGFDDDFFAHQEEIDLCWRAINKVYYKV